MCRQEELHLIGKLGSREVVAAVSSGPKGRIALLVDKASQQWFLVDTGIGLVADQPPQVCAGKKHW